MRTMKTAQDKPVVFDIHSLNITEEMLNVGVVAP